MPTIVDALVTGDPPASRLAKRDRHASGNLPERACLEGSGARPMPITSADGGRRGVQPLDGFHARIANLFHRVVRSRYFFAACLPACLTSSTAPLTLPLASSTLP